MHHGTTIPSAARPIIHINRKAKYLSFKVMLYTLWDQRRCGGGRGRGGHLFRTTQMWSNSYCESLPIKTHAAELWSESEMTGITSEDMTRRFSSMTCLVLCLKNSERNARDVRTECDPLLPYYTGLTPSILLLVLIHTG